MINQAADLQDAQDLTRGMTGHQSTWNDTSESIRAHTIGGV